MPSQCAQGAEGSADVGVGGGGERGDEGKEQSELQRLQRQDMQDESWPMNEGRRTMGGRRRKVLSLKHNSYGSYNAI